MEIKNKLIESAAKAKAKVRDWYEENKAPITAASVLIGSLVGAGLCGYITGSIDGKEKGYKKGHEQGVKDGAYQTARIIGRAAVNATDVPTMEKIADAIPEAAKELGYD